MPKSRLLLLLAVAVTSGLLLSALPLTAQESKPLSRIQQRVQAETQKFLASHADHFRPLSDINAILVNYSYDDSLFPWIDKLEAVTDAVETVKLKLPPELQDRVMPMDETKTYSGLNVHLDFYVLAAPFQHYPAVDADRVAVATTALVSYEVLDGSVIGRSLERRVEKRVRTVKNEEHFDRKDRTYHVRWLTEMYTERLSECIEATSYESCTINDLGYFDVNVMRGVAIGPG